MQRRDLGAALAAAALLALATSPAEGETIYFKNKRAIEAQGYEVRGRFIHIQMTNGATVPLPADAVDWEGTERIKQGTVVLERAGFDAVPVGAAEEGEELGPADRTLTASDLKKTGAGFKLRRAAAPTIGVEVPASGAWSDSRVNVRAGQALTIRASGRVTVAAGVDVGPEGSPAAEVGTRLDAEQPGGALLVRVGLGGTVRAVGRSLRMTAPAAGRLFFAVNDASPEDNSGAYTVYVELPQPGGGTGTLSTANPATSAPAAGDLPAGAAPAPGAPPPQKGFVGGVDRARGARGAAEGRAPTGGVE